jgi:hypothetical protein
VKQGGLLTGFCWEHGFIIEKVLDPCHDIVDVRGCGKMDTFAILIDPCVVETAGCCGKRMGWQWGDTYFVPADMVGHDCCVQHSDMTP